MIRPFSSLFRLKAITGVIVLVTLIAIQAYGQADHASVTFTAMGCGPYTLDAEQALVRFIALENQDRRSAFIIHLGDIVSGKFGRTAHERDDQGEGQYAKVASFLEEGNRIPTFIVPGDNEWNDRRNPEVGWALWTKYFMHFDEKFPFEPPVARQPGRPENFAFVLKEVQFIGINKVGGRHHDQDEWAERLDDNARWITQHLEQSRSNVRAAVIFAQATATGLDGRMLTPLQAAAQAFAKPILYLHADGHRWFVKRGEWSPNIVHVQTDLIDWRFPPVQITVTTHPGEPFVFDRRIDKPSWVQGAPD